MLAIRDRTFELSSATFGAILLLDEEAGWRFQWWFEFESIGRTFDGQTWEPRLYAEALKLFLPAPISLPGETVHVRDAYDADDEPNFSLYVFGHEPAYEIEMTFGPWQAEAIDLTLKGKADVNWGDEYGASLPIRVDCEVLFKGVNVWDSSEESARSRLAAYYDPGAFAAEDARIGFNYRLRLADSG